MKNIVLGTVQLGLEYGINNKTGKPSKHQSFEILEYAVEKGITCFDTAAAYGNSEEVIGEFIKTHGLGKDINLISKLKPNLVNNHDKNAYSNIIDEIEKSLYKLNVDKLKGYLLHTPSNFYSEYIMDGLNKIRNQGLLENIGVSVYEVKDALEAAKSTGISYIQVSYNILDQRLDKTDFNKIAGTNGHTVFARSPFLQGLILMDIANIPSHLERAIPYLIEFQSITKKYKYSRTEAALLFSLLKNKNNVVIYGVETLSQLKENIAIAESLKDNKEFVREIETIFNNVDEGIVIPSLWAKKE